MELTERLPEAAATRHPARRLECTAQRIGLVERTGSRWKPIPVALGLVAALTGCLPPIPPPPPPNPTPDVLRQDGLPGLTLDRQEGDLSVSDVETAIGEPLDLFLQTKECALGVAETRGLAVVYQPTTTAVLGFIVEDPRMSTPEGIHVGSTQNEIVQAFGDDNVAVIDGLLSQTGGPLVLTEDLENPGQEPSASTLHYGFDTDSAGRVTRLRAGFWPYVSYTDYCSMEATRAASTGWPLTN
jgi:hypothetical protein